MNTTTKRLITTIVSTTAMLFGGTVLASPAEAYGSPGCTTRAEFLWSHRDLERARVDQVFEVKGQFGENMPDAKDEYVYPTCQPGYWAVIEYFSDAAGSRTTGGRYWSTDYTPGCVTPTEFKRIDNATNRWTEQGVRSLFDTNGRVVQSLSSDEVRVRAYPRCASTSVYRVFFLNIGGDYLTSPYE